MALIRTMSDRFSHLCEKQISGTGLAVFRICYSLVLLYEVITLFYFRHLIFDPVPFLERPDNSWGLVFVVWMLAAACLLTGALTRYAAVFNYALTLVTFSSFHAFEYHWDYAMVGLNLLLVFAPVSRRLSVDAWLLRRRPEWPISPAPRPSTVAAIWHYVFLALGVGLVYFDSVFHKLGSDMWLRGLGLWLPASLPPIIWTKAQALLNQQWLVRAAGYIVFIFEFGFLVLVWKRRLWLPLLVLGAALHLGILILFPIPGFALGVLSVLLLLVPVGFWESCLARAGLASEAPPATHTEPPTHVRWRRRALALFLAAAVSVQAGNIVFWSVTARRVAAGLGVAAAHERLANGWLWVVTVSRFGLGVMPHPVFMDGHFSSNPHTFRIVAEGDRDETVLPITDHEGLPTFWGAGRMWVFFRFRMQNAAFKPEPFSRGLKRLSAFWIGSTDRSFDDTGFRIEARELAHSFAWERDLLTRNLNAPWRTVGRARWRGGEFSMDVIDSAVFGAAEDTAGANERAAGNADVVDDHGTGPDEAPLADAGESADDASGRAETVAPDAGVVGEADSRPDH